MRKKAFAVGAVAILAIAAVGIGITEDDTHESEAVVPLVIVGAALVIGAIAGASGAYAVTSAYYEAQLSELRAEIDRHDQDMEAAVLAYNMTNCIMTYKNALANYGNVWPLTSEHHVRMAELAASVDWANGKQYDGSAYMEAGGVYLNSATMMKNSTDQLDALLSVISQSLEKWKNHSVFDGNIAVSMATNTGAYTTTDRAELKIGMATTAIASANKVYIPEDAIVYADADCIITASDGTEKRLSTGRNTLTGLEPGVYTLQTGVSYIGDFIPVLGAKSASCDVGMWMGIGDDVHTALYDGSRLTVDGVTTSKLAARVTPVSGSAEECDLYGMFEDLHGLASVMMNTMQKANSSAHAMWVVYDQAEEAIPWMTTLALPDEYKGHNLSAEQEAIMTIAAMQQIADYWGAHGDDLRYLSATVTESESVFVRGDVYGNAGTLIAENVIMTPMFTRDATLTQGEDTTVTAPAYAVIWKTDAASMSSWDGDTEAGAVTLMTLEKGMTIHVREIRQGDRLVNSIGLETENLSFIEAYTPGTTPVDPMNEEETKSKVSTSALLIVIILDVIATLLLFAGLTRDSTLMMVIGMALFWIGGLLPAAGILRGERMGE